MTSDFLTFPCSNLSVINTYVGDDGKLHFTNSAGADSVLPFKKGALTRVTLGSNNGSKSSVSYSVTNYPGYENYTTINFSFIVTYLYGGQSVSGEYFGSISYNAKTGVVTFPALYRYVATGCTMVYTCYLYYVE